MKIIPFLFLVLIVFGFPDKLYSQIKPDSMRLDTPDYDLSKFYDMSLEQLDSVKATGVSSELEKFINNLMELSSKEAFQTRTSPAIVSLVTKQDIEASGARDLIDVLRLVPGFHFVQDKEGKIGLAVRGNWAGEGKVLLMIDGQEMNEQYTAKVFFGNHYPVDLIERIEIIRGPGSAIYGGFAEFAVLNIITKNPDHLNGLFISSNQGIMRNHYGRQNYSLYAGTNIKGLKLGFSGAGGQAFTSDRVMYRFYDGGVYPQTGIGNFASLNGQSEINQFFFNGFLEFKGFSLRNITDGYRSDNLDQMNQNKESFQKYGLIGNYTEVKWKIDATENLTITPKFNINVQTPWEQGTVYWQIMQDTAIPDSNKGDAIVRLREGLHFDYDITHRMNLKFGGDVYTDLATSQDTNSIYYFGDDTISYTNVGIYSQLLYKAPWANLIFGARYEINSNYSPYFVPRFGITKAYKKWHYKFLISRAFKAPSIGNIYNSFDGNYNYAIDSNGIPFLTYAGRRIDPEQTFFNEAEVGYKLSRNSILTFNFFKIITENPIVYSYIQDDSIASIFGNYAGLYAYQNYKKSGSTGFEVDYRYKDKKLGISANYSFYTVKYSERILPFSVTNFAFNSKDRIEINDEAVIGIPNHKINFHLTYYPTKDLSIDLSSTFIGKIYAHDILVLDELDEYGHNLVGGELKRWDPNLLTNIYVRKKNFVLKGLDAGLGIYNLFNSKNMYHQPYFALNTPIPGASRELVFRMSYTFPFKKDDRKKL